MTEQPMPPIPASQTEQEALILATLEAVVAEFGAEHVYGQLSHEKWIQFPGMKTPQCRYVRDDGSTLAPVCIAAQVLYRLGISMAELGRCEGKAIHHIGFPRSAQIDLRGIHPDALYVLREAQLAQDNNRTWGEALAVAQSYVAAELRWRQSQVPIVEHSVA
jgi:hypothetical protein